MTVPSDIKAKYPHSVAVLRFPDMPSPRWFAARSPYLDAVVNDDGEVVVHGDRLAVVDGALPTPGTAVKLLFEKSYLFVEDKLAYDARISKEREEAEERRRAAYHQRLGDFQARAEAANAKLNVPVRWTSGEKPVLSGLSANSWGDGRNSRSVNHILLLEPVREGRFVREADTFLCTPASGTNGRGWTGDMAAHSTGNDGPFVSCINCMQCLKLAARWKDPSKRIEPELRLDGVQYHGYR